MNNIFPLSMPLQSSISEDNRKRLTRNDFLDYKKDVFCFFEMDFISYREMEAYIKIFDRSLKLVKNLIRILQRCEVTDIKEDFYLDLLKKGTQVNHKGIPNIVLSFNDVLDPSFLFVNLLISTNKEMRTKRFTAEYSNKMTTAVEKSEKPYLTDILINFEFFLLRLEHIVDNPSILVSERNNLKMGELELSNRERRLVENIYLSHAKSIRKILSLQQCDSTFDSDLSDIDKLIEKIGEKVKEKNCRWLDCETQKIKRFSRKKANKKATPPVKRPEVCFEIRNHYVPSKGKKRLCKQLVERTIREDDIALNCVSIEGNDTSISTMESSSYATEVTTPSINRTSFDPSSRSANLLDNLNVILVGFCLLIVFFIKRILS